MAEENNNKIFRQKSLDRIASPEQLTDYLHVTNPGIWVFMAMIILLLGGFFAWSTIGRIETIADARIVVTDGTAQIVLTGMTSQEMESGMTVRVGKDEFTVSTVETAETGISMGYAPVSLANGKYDAKVVIDSVAPISFLLSAK